LRICIAPKRAACSPRSSGFSGDFDLAEEGLQEAFRAAVEQWPIKGVPDNPRAWLISTGRFKMIDALRRRAPIRTRPRYEIVFDGKVLRFPGGTDSRSLDQASQLLPRYLIKSIDTATVWESTKYEQNDFNSNGGPGSADNRDYFSGPSKLDHSD
jgi:DNA-directed RNA polymerase specialized sigma24 family protein